MDEANPNPNPNANVNANSNVNTNTDFIHKAIALELLEEMKRGNDVSTLLSKDKIVGLIDKIKQKDANYYLCHLDLDNTNEANVNHFNENKNVLFKALLKEISANIKVDIEFYKIGVSCSGLKKRHALITKDIFYSSTQPWEKLDTKKAKNKTPYLNGCQVILETMQQKEKKSEWSNSAKPFRMRINFRVKEKENKPSSFFLYFPTEKEMKDTEELLFGMCKGEDKIRLLEKDLKEMERSIQASYYSYAMLKLLEVKNQIKRRKALLNTMRNASNLNMNQMMAYGKNLSVLFVKAHKAKKGKVNDDQYYHGEFNTIVKQPMMGNVIKRKEYTFDNCERIETNLETLRSCFYDCFNRTKPKGKSNCFVLQSSAEMINNNQSNGFNENDYRNKKYLSIDKDNHRLTLSQDDNAIDANANIDGNTTIDSDKVYEISNVCLNVNKTFTAHTPGYMVLCGPKLDDSIPLIYKYNNIDKLFNDPDSLKLKRNTASNDQRGKNISRIQIFHMKFKITPAQLDQINTLEANVKKKISVRNPMDNLIFFLTVTLQEGLSKKTKMVAPMKYIESSHLTIVEFNQEVILEQKEFEQNRSVYIEAHMIPKCCFNENFSEEEKIRVLDYFHPTYLGRAELTLNTITKDQREYSIRKDGHQASEEDILYITCLNEWSKDPVSQGFNGRDYSIGGYSFVPTPVNHQEIHQRANDPSIPIDIKQQYYDMQFTDDNEFLFRPDDSVPENQFEENIRPSVSEGNLKKILYNSRFAFLPKCEKFISREALDLSPNLACLSTEEKNSIATTHKKDDWIYKAPILNLALKNKNIGITDEREVLGENFYYNNMQEFHLPSEGNRERIEFVKGNNFNTIDFTNVDILQCKGFNNFQWIIGLPFKNEKTMNVFHQLLRQLRYNVNIKQDVIMQTEGEKLAIEKTIANWKKLVTEDVVACKISIYSIEFISKFILKEDSLIDIMIKKSEGSISSANATANKTLLDFLQDQSSNYANSLLNLPAVKELFEWCRTMNSDQLLLENKTLIEEKLFNAGKRNIIFKNTMTKEVKCIRNLDKDFTITVSFKGKKKTETFKANASIDAIVRDGKVAEKYDIPLYIEGQENIIGILNLHSWMVNERNKNEDFDSIFRRSIDDIFASRMQHSNNSINTEMQLFYGKYEPNVYAAKMAKELIEMTKKNMSTKDIMEYLNRKCIVNPGSVINGGEGNEVIHPENIVLNMNYANQAALNSFYNKFRLKMYDTRLRKDFMHLFSTNEWKLYLKKHSKGEISTDSLFNTLPPRSALKSSEGVKQLRDLVYFDIPSEKARGALWNYFLDIDSMFQETKERLKKDNVNLTSKKEIYDHFANIVKREEQVSILFTLIDNDTHYITPLKPKFKLNDDIVTIKTIAKAFFLWTKLEDKAGSKSKDSQAQYIYCEGLLRLIQRIYSYFNTPDETFWLIIGLAQVIEVFKQKNPIYNDEMSKMSLYMLVTKLILQNNYKEIYHKLLSLNFPIEFFLSKNISTFYCDYFSTDALIRVLDIFLLEAAIKEYADDKLEYLRILCTIPITLFEMNSKKILECTSIAQLDTVMEDLIVKTKKTSSFIEKLDRNVTEFFCNKNLIEKFTNSNPKTVWDKKRGVIESLMESHFKPIQKENVKFLKQISTNKSVIESSKSFIENFNQGILTKLDNIKQVYRQGAGGQMQMGEHPTIGVIIQVNKLSSLFYPSNLETNMAMYCMLSNDLYNGDKFNKPSEDIEYNLHESRIVNSSQLYFEFSSRQTMERYAHFILVNKLKRDIAWFTLEIDEIRIMKLSTFVLESFHHEKSQLVLEVSLMKYSLNNISSDDLALYNSIFSTPEYIYNEAIDNEMNPHSNLSKAFDKEILKLITEENKAKMKLSSQGSSFADAGTILEIYKMNTLCEAKREKIIVKDSKDAFAKIIINKVEELLKSMIPKEIADSVMNWLKETNSSFEEILYSLVLIDKNSCEITDKMYLLFSIAKMSQYFIYEKERVTVEKIKEMVYSLYKRYMIYFTKNEIDRMVDYLVHEERLFNVKCAIAYNDQHIEKIKPIIYPSNSFSASKAFDVSYEDISVQLNSHINYLINHHNVTSLSPEIMLEIIKEILSKVQHKKFKDNQYNTIHIEISSDNIQYSRQYRFTLSPISIQELTQSKISPKSSHLKDEDAIKQEVLCLQSNSINLFNSYASSRTVAFDQFKKIFFALPFISDLMRVSCSYINEMKEYENTSYDYIKICVGLEQKTVQNPSLLFTNYYFTTNQNIQMQRDRDNILILEQVRPSWTIKDLLDLIVENYQSTAGNTTNAIIEFCKKPHLMKFSLNDSEYIGLYECLSSNMTLKHNRKAEISFLLAAQNWTQMNNNIVVKDSGYSKFYYTPTAFEWRKCWMINQQNTKKIYFKCCSNPTPLQASEGDIIVIGDNDA